MTALVFWETMTGAYRLAEDDRERPMSFTIGVRSLPLLRFLRRPLTDIRGEVDAVGFADHRPLEGTLLLDGLVGRELVYDFTFPANDGRRCRFLGRKDLSRGTLAEAMTTLPGQLLDESGAELGRALLRFDLRTDLLSFLASFRLARA